MEGGNLFWMWTPPENKIELPRTGPGCQKRWKFTLHSGWKECKWERDKERVREKKNPDAGFKITEQILSICLAHLILCCIEETVMDKVNPASPSGCVLAWTEPRTVTHSRETHTYTQSPASSQNLPEKIAASYSSLFLLLPLFLGETHHTRRRNKQLNKIK